MRVAALFRVSSDAQASRGASLAAQERRFDQAAAERGWTVVAKVRGAERATIAGEDRAMWQTVKGHVERGECDAIYVHEQSRLLRGSEEETARFISFLLKHDVQIIIGGQLRDLDSIDGRFMFRIQAAVDRTDSERLVERSRRGKREKAQRGQWHTGEAPYGYMNPPTGDPRRGTLQIVPAEAAIVRRIFAAVAAGQTVNSLWAALNREGIRPPKGRGWGNTTLYRLLRNPAYIGTLASFRWAHENGRIRLQRPVITVENVHEAIIDLKTWNRVQQRIQARRRRGVAPALLTGLLHIDGRRMTGDSNGRVRYYCPSSPPGPWLRREGVDALAWDGFTRMILSPEWIDQVRQAASRPVEHDAGTSAHKAAVARLEGRLAGLTTMRADGEIGKGEFNALAGEVRQQLAEARMALASSAQPVQTPETDEFAAVVGAIAPLLTGELTPAECRQLLESVVDRIDAEVERQGNRWAVRDLSLSIVGGMDGQRRSWVDFATVVQVIQAGRPVLRVVRRAPLRLSAPAKGAANG